MRHLSNMFTPCNFAIDILEQKNLKINLLCISVSSFVLSHPQAAMVSGDLRCSEMC